MRVAPLGGSFLVPWSLSHVIFSSPSFCSFSQCITDRLQYVSAGAESAVRLAFFSRRRVTLASPRLICQLLCILTPHRLGSAIGRPRCLVTYVPSFPPA